MRPHNTPEHNCSVLAPHPRWRWGAYPLRWLLGGCWNLCRLPISGLTYGGVFFTLGWIWSRTLSELSAPGFGLATGLTLLTLLLAPQLTAGLLDGMDRVGKPDASGHQRARHDCQGPLFEIGLLLVLILALALNAVFLAFALLYSGDVPVLELLPAEVFSWRNAPLIILWVVILSLAMLGMQLVAVVPTLILRETETDLLGAVRPTVQVMRLNWRPLVYWALCSQLLLLAGAGLMPASLILLAPLLAHGSWWAYREVMSGGSRAKVLQG